MRYYYLFQTQIECLQKYFNTSIPFSRTIASGVLAAVILVAIPNVASAQTFVTTDSPFGLTDIGTLSHPVFVDLDDDGDLDIMGGSLDGTFSYFENTGTASAPAFAAVQTNPFSLTSTRDRSTPTFADLDNDGDLDLMAGEVFGGFWYFENVGTASAPSFAAYSFNAFGLLSLLRHSTPTFADLDNDGDLDLMSGERNDSFNYFENTGTASAPAFAAVQINPFSLPDGLRSGSPLFVDLDNDGDFDLMAGTGDGNFHYHRNDGTASAPVFTTAYINSHSLSDIGNGASPSFGDLDNDGDLDLISGENGGNFHYFRNNGTASSAILLATRSNPFSLTDIGDNSTSTLADLDNDGDLDIMAGDNAGNFHYFPNTGTVSMPVFGTVQTNPFSLNALGGTRSTPSLADLDNDGDLDLMAGDLDGNFSYFENIGTASAPAFAAVQTNPFALADIGIFSAPTYVDLDNDGDLDLLSGESNGDFNYFENTGTASVPTFAAVQVNPFGLDDLFDWSVPSFADLDHDGDLDLVYGNDSAILTYFENTGTASAPAFANRTLNAFGLSDIGDNAALSFGDLDNDGDLDLMVGENTGNFYYFENQDIAANTVIWDGESSTDWEKSTNWVGDVVPTSGSKVIIVNGANNPTISSAIEVSVLDVRAGATLTIMDKESLTVNDFTALHGSLSVASGSSFIPMGIILGQGAATIDRNTTFGTSDGQYSVIGSPITDGSTASLGGIVYGYDETVAYDPSGTAGGARFVPVISPETMTVGDAYFSANTGDIAFKGRPNSGNQDVSLVYDESNDGMIDAGFNLVSNPYTAAVSYTSLMAGNSDIDGTIYLWDDGGSNTAQGTNSDYITANSMGAASGGSSRAASWDGYIRSAQGFFVKAATAGTLSFTPTMMDTGNNTDGGFFREEEPTVLRFSLSSKEAYNDILIGFAEDATLGLDRSMDAHKIKGSGNIQLYSRSAESILAIQALPFSDQQTMVDLGFDALEGGTYTINMEDISSYSSEVVLIDNLLNQSVSLTEAASSYTFETGAVHNSNRFSLVFSPNEVLAIVDQLESNDMIVFVDNSMINVRMNHELTDATVSIYSLSGAMIKQVNGVSFANRDWITDFNKAGLFVLTVTSDNQLFTQKFIKK